MGRPCARQSNIPRPPFPSRNRLDEVHAARPAQTVCAFRRGGCHPPAGRTLCAPTLRVLFLGRVELQGEVRDMGPGRRCHAAARARPGRFRCGSGWSPGRHAALCAYPPRLNGITLPLGARPGRQLLRLRANPVRPMAVPGLCPSAPESVSPVRLSSALLYHAAAAAQRAASLRLGTQTVGPSALLGLCSSLQSIRAAPHASALKFDAWR